MTALATSTTGDARVEDLRVTAASIPTDEPESDGTLAWDATSIVVVELRAGGLTGLGWTYGHESAAAVIRGKLADSVVGAPVMDIPAIWLANERAMRNSGRQGSPRWPYPPSTSRCGTSRPGCSGSRCRGCWRVTTRSAAAWARGSGRCCAGVAITGLSGVFPDTQDYQAVWGVCALAVLASRLPVRRLCRHGDE